MFLDTLGASLLGNLFTGKSTSLHAWRRYDKNSPGFLMSPLPLTKGWAYVINLMSLNQ